MAPGSAVNAARETQGDSWKQAIQSAQLRLLYANTNVAVGVNIIAATILGYLQWGDLPNRTIIAWWLYIFLVSVLRWLLAVRYQRALRGDTETGRWGTAFTAGAALAGVGWGGAGLILYAEASLENQVFLVFVLGGMMIGAVPLLAPRQEAFLAFLIPTGVAPAVRLLLQGDETHVAMGLLALVFTLATLATAGRICSTIESTLRLQLENRDLVEGLQAAKRQTETLNEELEVRIEKRTAELKQSTERLRAEISQREQMEEELLRTRKLESLGLLAGGIAHDFNNFLTIIQGNIELAKRSLYAAHIAQGMLDQAASTCRRAVLLSSQLLTFAKGGAPVRRAVPVAKLVTDAVQLARAGTAVSIAVDIQEDLRYAEVDPGQIGQVLHNILLNARQSMPDGGSIEVRAENVDPGDVAGSGPRVRISIRDRGTGITADILPRIFDPYFTTKPGGGGLGLATAYSIVTKHGGHMWAESKSGEGTVVTVELPALLERPPEPPAVAEVQRGTERILVMDDEEALLKLLRTVLRNFGYEVETARDGAEAVALYEGAMAEGRRFDAVLLDLTVSGGMGGIEAAERLKAMDPAARLVASSGYSEMSVGSDLGRYGFDAMIPKPWTSVQMSMVFRKLFAGEPGHENG